MNHEQSKPPFISRGCALVLMAPVVGGCAVCLIVTLVVLISRYESPRTIADKNVKEQISLFHEKADIAEVIWNREGFQSAKPKIVALDQQLKQLEEELDAM